MNHFYQRLDRMGFSGRTRRLLKSILSLFPKGYDGLARKLLALAWGGCQQTDKNNGLTIIEK